MKKVFVFLLLLTPLYGFSQNLELGINGGVSINTNPTIGTFESYSIYAEQGGVNPFVQVSGNYKISNHIKVGLSANYLTASGKQTDKNGSKTGKLFSPIFQIMPHVLYSFGKSKFTFDAGVQIGVSIYSIHKSEIGIITIAPLTDNGNDIKAGFATGLVLRASRKITKNISLTLSLNPVYNHLKAPENIQMPRNSGYGSRDYSFFTFPASLGIAFTL